jgi:hypothetical protein
MAIRLRLVIYQNKVEIDNVPVYVCESCHASEVLGLIKPELTQLISSLGKRPKKQRLKFDEISEVAYLLLKVTEKERLDEPVESIIEERINELLDMLILAQSLQDDAWMEDIRMRLGQLTKHTLLRHDSA